MSFKKADAFRRRLMDPYIYPWNSLPGSSKTEDIILDPPHKRVKVGDEVLLCDAENDEVKSKTEINSTNIDDLYDEILVEIFKYLSFKDRLVAQKACCRWFHLLQSPTFWKILNLSSIPLSLFVEIFVSLPSCVSQLRVRLDHCYQLPISLPELMGKLHDQCPVLEYLIIENTRLRKNLYDMSDNFIRRSKILNNNMFFLEEETRDDPIIQMIESHFHNEKDMELMNAALPKLRVLSLRQVLFSQCHVHSLFSKNILPEIVVLDLSHSKPPSMEKIEIGLFYTLVNLEELYLAGWEITDDNLIYFFRSAKKLRVLDLEHSRVTGETISVLKKHCSTLQELYLGFCNIESFPGDNENKQFFPNLKKLCIKKNYVAPRDIKRLVAVCPSLKFVNISYCEQFNKLLCRKLYKNFEGKVAFCYDDRSNPCNHFLKSQFSNF